MDSTLFILINACLLTLINRATPALCRGLETNEQNGKEDELTLEKYSMTQRIEPLQTSESPEPDTSGDVAMTPGDDNLSKLLEATPFNLSPETSSNLTASVERVLLTESPEEGEVKSEEKEESDRKTNTLESSESEETSNEEKQENNLVNKLFGELSTEYADDYNKAMEEGQEMDPEKEYTVRTVVPGEGLLVLGTPSGCSLLDFGEETEGLQMVEFKFKTSQLEDCSKLNEDILNEMNDQLARELAQNREPTTKMVEISVRDPMRNRELNIKETTEVFTLKENKEREKEDFQDFRNRFDEVEVEERDKKEAMALLAETLDFNFLPTNSDSVFIMSYSYKEQEERDANKEQMMKEFYKLLDKVTEKRSEEEKGTFKELFKNLENLSNDKFEKFLEEMKSLLETEEGKKAVEKFSKEMDKQVEKTKEFVKKEVETGKQILEELSKQGVESVECNQLSKDECNQYSKCEVMEVQGKEMCFVSPRTVYWLMETNCGLQSKAALMSVARDLESVGLINEKRLNNLQQSFDLNRICNAITHAYLSKLAPKVNQQPNKAFI